MGSSRAKASCVDFLVNSGVFSVDYRCNIKSRFSDPTPFLSSVVVS